MKIGFGLSIAGRNAYTLGPDIKANGITNTSSTPPTPPAYNTGTGVGSVSRSAGGIASVGFTGLTTGDVYVLDVTHDGPHGLALVDQAIPSPTTFSILATGRQTVYVTVIASGAIWFRCATSGQTQTFTLHSIRKRGGA